MRYKLIKKYPGLPKDWKVGIIVGTGDRQGQACFSPCSGKYTDKHIDHNDVINNPEFWEEVIEYPVGTKVRDVWNNSIYEKNNGHWIVSNSSLKYIINELEIGKGKRFELVEEPKKSYEILSFQAAVDIKVIEKGTILHKMEDGTFRKINVYPNISSEEHLLLNNSNWEIHSVRRMSDGEVFTVGDVCEFGKITKIFITEGGYCMTATTTSNYSCNIMYLKKTKPVLFTTVDGVDIREGDKYYYIEKNGLKSYFNFRKLIANSGVISDSHSSFSTREKAEEYLLLNKPCLSINDIQSIYVSAKKGYKKNGNETNYFEELINLVKSRL